VPDGSRIAGLFDTRGLEALVARAVEWGALRENIDRGSIVGLAVAATEIASGKAIVFVDRPGGSAPSCAGDPLVVTEGARITAQHALASAAIPMIFPAVRIGKRFYSDGGLRMNTPLAPALRMGADRVLVIGLRHADAGGPSDVEDERETVAQSPIYLAGKALNALLLDPVEYDLDRLRLFNDILRGGIAAYGEGFVDRINEPVVARRGHPYKIVESLFIRPSRDLGIEAAECLRGQLRAASGSWLKRRILGYLADSEVSEADFLSYLYFDACYAARLVEMGRHDAAAAEDALIEFFS
jgi:NTE family protein